jgi:Mor family transcriptional regulator
LYTGGRHLKYQNAKTVLPDELLKEIQKYVQGEMVYIPKPDGIRKGWGEKTGNKEYLRSRNYEIKAKFREGSSIDQLTAVFCLSYDSIKKIVYSNR